MRKKMKKETKSAVVMILSLALTGAVLTGCGGSRQSRQDTQQESAPNVLPETVQDTVVDEVETKQDGAGTEPAGSVMDEAGKPAEIVVDEADAEPVEKTDQAAAGYEDNFAVDSKTAKEFAEKVKAAVADKDLEALADLTAFPVYVGLPDAGVVETREDFIKLGAENVFTEELLQSVEMADIENLQPSMAGFSVSDERIAGINFGVADGALAINGINY